MSEIYGPLSYHQHLAAEFDQINPNCRCIQSKILRSTGIKLVLQGRTQEEVASEGLSGLMQDCPKSMAVGLCCDIIQKCTKVEFVQTDTEGLVSMAEASIFGLEADSNNTEGTSYE